MAAFLQTLAANFWMSVILMLFVITIVSIVLGIGLEAYKIQNKSRQKLLELRNEEMRLHLMAEQQKREQRTGSPTAPATPPKDVSWEEQSHVNYEMGYQQQHM